MFIFQSVVGVLVIMVVSVVFSIFIARVLLEVGEMEGTIPKGWGSYIAMLANAIQIQVLGYLYPYMAKALTDYGA